MNAVLLPDGQRVVLGEWKSEARFSVIFAEIGRDERGWIVQPPYTIGDGLPPAPPVCTLSEYAKSEGLNAWKLLRAVEEVHGRRRRGLRDEAQARRLLVKHGAVLA